MNNFGERVGRFLEALAQGCGIIAAGFGFVALLGWVLALPFLSSFGSHLIPMAPSTALLFGLLGTATSFCVRLPQSRIVCRMCIAIGAFSVLVALLLFCLSSLGTYLDAERLGIAIAGQLNGVPIGHMSPVTALSFVFVGLSFLASLSPSANRRRRKTFALGFASLVIAANYVFALAYFVGPPLLYGGSFIPPALPTSLAFVALGIALAATARTQAGQPSELTGAVTTRASYTLLLVFILMALGIVTAGHLYYRNYESHYRTGVEHQLTAIADLKTGEIIQWRKERLGDASVFYKNTAFSLLVERYFDHPNDREAQKQLRTWLQRVQTVYQYDRLCLNDIGSVERMSVPETRTPTAAAISQRVSEVLRSGKIAFEDFYHNEIDRRVYLNILVPVFDKDNTKIIGTLAMRIDPEKYLYPLINRWPTPSRTAETLIVRREGNEVVFLNELRFQKNTALKLRNSLDRRDMPAVQAVMGEKGVIEGVDYRGVSVIASVRDIPDSPWFLVARMDVSEVYAPLQERLWAVILLVSVLLLGAGAGMGLIWRQQHARFYREKYKAVEALRESMEIQRAIVETSPLAIIVTNSQGNVTLWNSAAETTFGWSAGEVIGMQNPIIPADMVDEVRQTRQSIMDGRSFIDIETQRVRKDGTRITVSFSATALRDARGRASGALAIVADITQRKRAEESIRRLNRVLAVLSDINQAIVRIREPQTLFDMACRIAVEKGNFSLAWIGLLDEATGEIKAVAHAGTAGRYLEKIRISLKDEPLGYCPIDGVLRTGKRAICNMIGTAEDRAPCQETILDLGFRSAASFPLTVFGRITGTVNLYADKPDHFDEAELKLLDEMAIDISFAMEFAEKEAERERAEEMSRTSHRFLEIVHNHTEMLPLLREYVSEIKRFTGCDAVGIRVLDENGGIPYQAYDGFSRKFYELENPLSVVTDHCMCINVISGATDPILPFYSEGGSFFINATTRFLATVSEEEKGKTRNVCNREGYESVALIPFRMENRILGLIHVADHRENMVPLRTVEMLEKAAMQLGTALKRVRAEETVRESERRYRSLFENMLEGFAYCRMIFDGGTPRDFLYLDVNNAFATLTGLKNVVGKKVSEVIPGLRASNPKLFEIYGRVALTGKPEQFEDYVAPLGIWFSIAVYSPEKGYFIAVFDNITERKTQELRVQMLNKRLESLVRVVQRLSSARTLEDVTSAVRTSARSIVAADGATFVLRDGEFCHYADEDAIAPLWKGQRFPMSACISGWAMLNKQSVVVPDIYQDPRIPVDAYRPTFVKSLAMVPIRTTDPIGAVGVYWASHYEPAEEEVRLVQTLADAAAIALENVHLYNELEERVRNRTAQLEAANRELEAFSYSVSHDLRGPLRAIDGFSRILLEDYGERLDTEGKRLFNVIRTNTQHMDQLITDLLALSRVSKSELKLSRVDMTAMARSIYHEVTPPEIQQKFVLKIASLPDSAGDPTLLRQVWSNLLSNAVKFTLPQEKRQIDITGHSEEDINIYSIRDTGVGFNPVYTHKLFGVFQRLHKIEEFEGNGVGLAIVQRIIHRHGGRVWAEGKVKEGSTFSFSLPRIEVNHESP